MKFQFQRPHNSIWSRIRVLPHLILSPTFRMIFLTLLVFPKIFPCFSHTFHHGNDHSNINIVINWINTGNSLLQKEISIRSAVNVTNFYGNLVWKWNHNVFVNLGCHHNLSSANFLLCVSRREISTLSVCWGGAHRQSYVVFVIRSSFRLFERTFVRVFP